MCAQPLKDSRARAPAPLVAILTATPPFLAAETVSPNSSWFWKLFGKNLSDRPNHIWRPPTPTTLALQPPLPPYSTCFYLIFARGECCVMDKEINLLKHYFFGIGSEYQTEEAAIRRRTIFIERQNCKRRHCPKVRIQWIIRARKVPLKNQALVKFDFVVVLRYAWLQNVDCGGFPQTA